MNSIHHESAKAQVTGEALYIDDMPLNDKALLGFVYKSPLAHAKIIGYNLEKARQVNGIHAILSHKDINGINNLGPIIHDEETLASEIVNYKGQVIFIIAAETPEAARTALKLIEIEFQELQPIVTIEEAITKNNKLQESRKIERGNIEKAFIKSKHIIEGQLKTGAQEHWYLETQIAVAIPGEENEIKVYSSTQNPMETQLLIAENLEIPINNVEVEIRRMGGAFGGKETQANHIAVWAALLANYTKRTVKLSLERDDDQIITGKRHPFLINYKIGFNNKAKIIAYSVELNQNAGHATDVSMAILERAMLHAENAYYIPNIKIIGTAWKTNTASNTAFRGFGGPQAMAAIENAIDAIARKLNIKPEKVRKKNFYSKDKNITPYQQTVQNPPLKFIYNKLKEEADYKKRRKKVEKFNEKNDFFKKGIAITPVKFGISFTTAFLNQAGALVNIYMDGTALVNHGGTEMGQGLNTKMQQIAATELGIDITKVKVNATNTSKIPNTSPTAASSGTDMNGMAVKNACEKLITRIIPIAEQEIRNRFNIDPQTELILKFANNFVTNEKDETQKIPFHELVQLCRINRVSLSATGFYKTPNLGFNRQTGVGTPFYYYAYGISASEVLLDTLTGYVKVLRTDILHDAGNSINKNIDLGQIAGGFVQGLGWVTTEECKWDTKGTLLNHSPDTYKIPTIADIPEVLNISLLENSQQNGTIYGSKAVGEPPFMHAFSVWLAIKDAIAATRDHKIDFVLNIPATNENILLTINQFEKTEDK